MATERNRRRTYATYGNVAYQSDGSAARRVEEPVRRRAEREQEQRAIRPVVQVREQEGVALFAVVGIIALGLCALLFLSSLIQLTTVTHESFKAQDKLTTLRAEEKKLQTQYELVYDLNAIEQQMTSNGTMVHASSSDTVYLNLAGADSVLFFAEPAGIFSGAMDWIRDYLS